MVIIRLIGNLSCMLAMLISLLRLAAATHKATLDMPAPVPEASPDYDKFLIGCTEKVSPECGEELVATMTVENGAIITDECCEKLLAMGKACHYVLVRYIAEYIDHEGHKFNGNEALAKYMEKGEQMWGKCASLAKVLHASS